MSLDKSLTPFAMSLLEIQNLKVYFPLGGDFSFGAKRFLKAVDDVSFKLEIGETIGLVGESGCGKSTLGRAILRLNSPSSGHIVFDGTEITHLQGSQLQLKRRGFQMVFQDANGSLNPRLTISQSLSEPMDIHRLFSKPLERRQRLEQLLSDVGMEHEYLDRYPHELSGGQRQRIGIARALAVEPRLLICDEPVSALDVSVQAQIINLLQDIQKTKNLAYLFISHDLAVVQHISHRLLVMYLGKIVEMGTTQTICKSPAHPYTRILLASVPSIKTTKPAESIFLKGDVPSPLDVPLGCSLCNRCPFVMEKCFGEQPDLLPVGPNHWARCHLVQKA